MTEGTEDRIVAIISNIKDKASLTVEPDTNFFQDGLLDSIDFLELVSACEQAFGVTIDLLETDIQQISSLTGLAEFIDSSRKAEG